MNHQGHKEGDHYRSFYEDRYVWSRDKTEDWTSCSWKVTKFLATFVLPNISWESGYNIRSERI